MAKKHYYLLLLTLISALPGRSQHPGYVMSVSRQAVYVDTTDGRKLLIVLLPAQPDTAFTGQLLRFQSRHGQRIKVIAVLAPGTGALVTANRTNPYAALAAAGIALTEGMAETDSAAGRRSGFLKFVSHKNRNRQVDHFAEGSKFFLSEKGRVFAEFGKTTSLDSRLADYMVQTKVPGDDRYQ